VPQGKGKDTETGPKKLTKTRKGEMIIKKSTTESTCYGKCLREIQVRRYTILKTGGRGELKQQKSQITWGEANKNGGLDETGVI